MDDREDDLLVRSRKDAAAFEPLVRRLAVEVYAYLARRAPQEAEDLVAQVWAQAFTTRHSFDPAKGPARAWVFGVARHVLWAHLHLRVPVPLDHAADPVAASVDPWPAVDDRLAAAAVAPELRAALRDLGADEREVLLLVAWERLTPSEAAAVLCIPAATARPRLRRARLRLRERLDAGGRQTGVAGVCSE